MRKLVTIILIFITLSASAGWVRGSITMKDGSELTGYIKEFRYESEDNIDFRASKKSELVEINSEDIEELVMRYPEGTIIAKFVHTSSIGIKGEYNQLKEKRWMRVIFRGDFDVMGNFVENVNLFDYYISWPGEDTATMIYINDRNGVIAFTKEELLQKSVQYIFTDRCDSLVKAINEKSFSPDDVRDILRFYVNNCKKADSIGELTF